MSFSIALGPTSALAIGKEKTDKADDKTPALKQDKGPSKGDGKDGALGKEKNNDKSSNSVKKKAVKKAGAAAATGVAAGAATKKLKSGLKDD